MRQTPIFGPVPLVLCVVVFSIGATIFSGWLLHMPVLLKIFSGQVAMKPNAALGFILCSITMALLLHSGLPKATRPVLAMVSLGVTGLAILTLSQDIFGWNLGIDEWLFRDVDQSGRTAQGRISPPASFCFALIGLALATLSLPASRPLRSPVVSALGTATVIVSVLSLGGHLINVLQGNRSWNFSPVAVDTALSFLMLGSALLLAVREKGGLARYSEKVVIGGFVAGIAALLIAAGTAYYFVRQLQLNAMSAAHYREVLEQVEILRRNFSEKTNNLRGYVISGDEQLAQVYGQNLADTGKAFQSVRNLLADEPKQLAQLTQLVPLRAVMDDLHSRILAERRTHGFAAARQLVLQSEGVLLDSQVNRVLDITREYASGHLQNQQSNFARSARETFLTLPMGVFVSITTLLLGLFLLDASTGERLRMQEARRDSDALFRAIFEATPDGIIMTDASRNIVMTNPGADKMFGYGPGELLGSPVTRVFSGLESEQIRREREDLLAHPGASLVEPVIGRAWQLDGIRDDNSHFPTEVIRSAFTSPRGTFVIGVTRDITARVKMQDDLLQREAGLHRAQVVARLSHVITRPDGSFESWSDSLTQMTGRDHDAMPKTIRAWLDLLHPDDRELLRSKSIEAGVSGSRRDFEYRLRRMDGIWIHIRHVMEPFDSLPDAQGRRRWFNTMQDISERKQAEARIEYLATHDELTDLPNRNLIRDRIVQGISHAKRAGRQLALIYLDIDRFKVINDAWGHPFGDAVLKAVGERLQTVVRDDDTVARLSGDEFLLLLADLRKSSDAYVVAQKTLDAFVAPFSVDGREVYVGVSLGVSVYPQHGSEADNLISNADVAMYRSKELGRSTYQFFTQEMSNATRQQVEMETRLRVAIERDELHLVYQPKVDIGTGQIVGSEALLRWTQPELGVISPVRFIPIAEESGLIVPIGNWVLRTACLQNKAWLDAGLQPGVVSVNVSARQFLQQDVVAWVLTTLDQTGLPPELLELELTESLIAQDTEKVITTVAQLKAAGVKLSIDDFGTGYSSLSYLKRFRVDTLKIDQSFIRNMLDDPDDAVIALAVISLAHSLKLKVIAEGVETAAHCEFLRTNGCDEIQGYYFSKPVLPGDYAQMLISDKRLLV